MVWVYGSGLWFGSGLVWVWFGLMVWVDESIQVDPFAAAVANGPRFRLMVPAYGSGLMVPAHGSCFDPFAAALIV